MNTVADHVRAVVGTSRSHYEQLRLVASKDGLRLFDRTGRVLQGVVAIDLTCRPSMPPVMKVVLACGQMDVADAAPAFMISDPATGEPKQVRFIEFADGSTFEAHPPIPKEGQNGDARPETLVDEPPTV